MRLLVAEDHDKLAHSIADGLREEGYTVDLTLDGNEAAGMLVGNRYDCIILDIMLPGREGWTILQELRDRSVASRARGIDPPADLNSPKRIAAGAGLYAEMCTGCHLGPGIEKSEMSQGLYPQAPELARGTDLSPAQQFWTIKHGIKLTAMPAWGKTHSDELIWDMVAFLQGLPKLSPEQYKTLVASAPEDHEEMMEEMKGGTAHAPPEAAGERSHSH